MLSVLYTYRCSTSHFKLATCQILNSYMCLLVSMNLMKTTDLPPRKKKITLAHKPLRFALIGWRNEWGLWEHNQLSYSACITGWGLEAYNWVESFTLSWLMDYSVESFLLLMILPLALFARRQSWNSPFLGEMDQEGGGERILGVVA